MKKELDQEKTVRRNAKEIIGPKCKNMCMLDSKRSKHSTLEYCDSIMICDNMEKWDNAMSELYFESGYEVDAISLKHNHKGHHKMLGTPFVTVNAWPEKHKLMVHGGNISQESLIQWIGHMTFYKQKMPSEICLQAWKCLWLLQKWTLKTPLYWIVASNFTCLQTALICIQSMQDKQ